MLDLEQFIGQEIDWISGETFDDIIKRGDKIYLPNKVQRFCTIEMKIKPIFYWWANKFNQNKTFFKYKCNKRHFDVICGKIVVISGERARWAVGGGFLTVKYMKSSRKEPNFVVCT